MDALEFDFSLNESPPGVDASTDGIMAMLGLLRNF
jgi:hypothetical protein